jgi:serine/threonine-protein kinase
MGKQQGQDQTAQGLSAGTVVDGRYKIVRFIGQGGNGLVHEVEHVWTGRRLALKSLVDESGFGRLEQEARATCLMKNAHAVRITDMGKNEGTGPYLVMELLDGQSLRALLEEAGQIPLELTINIALQVCECLTEAHALGIIHRDLKPENMFLCHSSWPGQYDVRILDFGVVKITTDGPIPNSSLTRTGSTVGTPYYMSLEQLRNPSNVDARADIYALGVVLYESLSGRKPFQAETIGDLVYALCSGPPTHLSRLRPDLPVDVCDAVMRALSTKKEDRQTTMVELAQVLLPHGNSAFGQWLRTAPKQRPAAPASVGPGGGAPARPMRTTVRMSDSVTPSGLKKAPPASSATPPPPSPPRADVAPMSATSAFPIEMAGSGDASARHKLMNEPEEGQEPTRVRPERPAISFSGDRETPTEMFVKGQHDAASPLPQAGDRNTPTRGLPMPHGGALGDQEEDEASRTVRYQGPSSSSFDTPSGMMRRPDGLMPPGGAPQGSEMLGTLRLPASSTIEEVRAAISAANAANMPGGMPHMSMGPGSMGVPPPSPSQSGPRFGDRGYGSQSSGLITTPSGSSLGHPNLGATMPPGGHAQRPGWQTSLDSALVKVGRFFEGIIGPIAARVRNASPKAQLVLAAVAASTVAAILVIVIYLLLG